FSLRTARGRSGGAAGNGVRGRSARPGLPRSRTPVRSRARSAVPRPAAAARSTGPRHRADPAPYRQRRLVAGDPRPRDRGPLSGLRRRTAVPPVGAAGAVRGLLALAAVLAAQRGPGTRNRLLARAAHGTAAAARSPHRPPASRGAELPRLPSAVPPAGRGHP